MRVFVTGATGVPGGATWLGPEQVAAVIGFPVSDAAGIVTGTAVNLSRG